MACITRCILRWGLISGLALGGATLLIGPERVKAGFTQIQSKAKGFVDDMVDDPVAIRHQLEELAKQYPDRISEVRGEMAEVQTQIGQFQRDVEIADRVVAMTTEDLRQLKTLVAQAESKQSGNARNVSFHFEGVRFNVQQAYTEAGRINEVRKTYQDRLAHDQQQLTFLTEQHNRLNEIAENLDTEFNKYQAQLWQLDRQIDAIERNERLIALMEQQQETLASYDKFSAVGNLGQIESKLAELRTKQEAQLQYLTKNGSKTNYEKLAEAQLDLRNLDENPFADVFDDVNEEETDEVTVEPTRSIAYNNN